MKFARVEASANFLTHNDLTAYDTAICRSVRVFMRWICLFAILVLSFMTGCRGRGGREEHDRTEVLSKPQSPEFKDFQNTWRQFISKSPELSVPVSGTISPERAAAEPIISSECLYSAEANGYVPQVTISWTDVANQVMETAATAARQETAKAPIRRFDLGQHYKSFERNLYSSALSTDKLKRFTLPSNSAMVANPQAVVAAGPGLFPVLADYQVEEIKDQKSNRRFSKETVVLSELNGGISNTLRVSSLAGREWKTDRYIQFMVPVCPVHF